MVQRPRCGKCGKRAVVIQQLPGMQIRSTWVAAHGAIDGEEARAVWRELGDGGYLVTMTAGPERIQIAVQVEDGNVDMEPVTSREAAALAALYRSITGDA